MCCFLKILIKQVVKNKKDKILNVGNEAQGEQG